jgi:trk system potassium uptake protein TrkA
MLDYIALGHGWFVVEIKVNETIASKTNYDTELDLAEVTLMAVKRGSQLLQPPYRGLLLQPDDQIVLCGLLDNLLKFAKKIL